MILKTAFFGHKKVDLSRWYWSMARAMSSLWWGFWRQKRRFKTRTYS